MIEMYGTKDNITGEIYSKRDIKQPFIAEGEHLYHVDIEFGTYCRVNKCIIRLEVMRDNEVLKTFDVKGKDLQDNTLHRFDIDMDLVCGERYVLRLSSPDARGGNAVTAKFGRKQHDFDIMLGGRHQDGELCCILYYDKGNRSIDELLEMKEEGPRFYEKRDVELSIIIPTANRTDHLKMCLDTLEATVKETYEVIVVINTPDWQTAKQAYATASLYRHCRVLSLPYYAGYVHSVNEGCKLATGAFVVVLNDDVLLRRGWDTRMKAWMADESVGQVGASLSYLDEEYRFSVEKTKRKYLEGWCFMVRKSLVEQRGYMFDPDIDFAYCEDSDLSLYVQSLGLRVIGLNVPIFHLGSQTSKHSGKELKEVTDKKEDKNRRFLMEKWG